MSDLFRFYFWKVNLISWYKYVFSKRDDNFCILVIVFGIDIDTSLSFCGPCSSVDFVRFIWEHSELFRFKKYAITLLPSYSDFHPPRMLFLKHHRADSNGWNNACLCLPCSNNYRISMRAFTNCIASGVCWCNICLRQPPFLLSLVARDVFTLVFNVERFELT